MQEVVKVSGNQSFMGKDIPVVLGGFGKDKKCVSDKTIAEIHGMRESDIRRRISDNIKRFKEKIDFIDLKSCASDAQQLLIQLGYTQMQISKAEHIYLLSERGYAKLIKIMDSDLAWEIHDKLIDEYFLLREAKKIQAKAQNERLGSVNNAVKILIPMLEAAGCDSKIQLLTAKTLYEKAGVELPLLIEADQQYFDTVHIARQVGVYYKRSGKPADKAVNAIIRKLDVPESLYTETWESKGKWQGTVRKYASQVMDMVRQWLIENDCPQKIEYVQCDGKKKCYHVDLRSREVA